MTYEQRDDVILPQYVLEQFSKLAKGEFIMTTGVGQHQMWAAQWTKFKHPRTWITSGGLGSMGYGLPAAMGAQAAFPDALVVDIDGDGSFVMNIQELATVHCEKLPVKVIVLNNQHLGMVVQWEDRFYASNRAHTYLGPIHHPEAIGQGDGEMPESLYPDFVEIARGFGVKARHVRRQGRSDRRPGRDDRSSRPVRARRAGPLPGARPADDPGGHDGARHHQELSDHGRHRPAEHAGADDWPKVAGNRPSAAAWSIGPDRLIDQEVILLHFLVERGAVDVEHPRRLLAVPVEGLKGLDDDPFLRFFQGFLQGPDAHLEVRPGRASADGACLAVVVEDRRQMARGDPGAVAEGDGSLNGGFELADVARPVVLLQDVERIAREAGDGLVKFAGIVGPERLGQKLDVGPPVPKRGEHEADHADAVIELLAKPALLDQGGQVFAGGHEEPRLARLAWHGRRWPRSRGTAARGADGAEARAAARPLHRDRACRRGPGPACWSNPASRSPRRGTESSGGSCIDSSSAIADPSTVMKGRSGLGPSEWINRARSDLPVPGSPTIRTEVRVAAIVAARSMTWRQLGSLPIKPISRAS